jgi:uncharacterized protein (DUF342 family)
MEINAEKSHLKGRLINKTLIIRADNAERAIIEAEKRIKCDRKQLKVHTIKSSYSKLWGLIRKQGEYRIEYISSDRNKEPSELDANGYVEVVSGKAIIKDPVGEGKYATVIVDDPNIEVYINNIEVAGVAVVTEKDLVEFRPKIIRPYTNISASISEDKMQATLVIEKVPGKEFFVKNSKRSNNVFICSDYKELAPEDDNTLHQCIDVLKNVNVDLRLIDINAIEKLINTSCGGSSIVAEGIYPVDGLNSKVKYLFHNSSYHNPEFDTDKKVNLLDHTIIPTVSVGDVLAIKLMPATPGRDGMTVTGEVIKAKDGKDIELKAGKGAALLENGMKVVATISGKPVLDDGTISVMPVLEILQDVCAVTGNIKYDGDIVIRGNIMDNMSVVAGCNITVFGNIFNASVSAKGNVEVWGSVIGSKISAGTSVVNYLCVLPKIEQILSAIKGNSSLNTEIENFIKEIENLFPLLSESEAETLNKITRKIHTALSSFKMSAKWSDEQAKELYDELCVYSNEIKQTHGRQANIKLKYVQKSAIQANGNIIITDRGSYLTNMIAKNAIIFNKLSSSVLGGVLVAGKSIKMGVVGSPAGITTYCRVLDKGGKINAAHYYNNTIININDNLKVIKSNDV